MHLLVGLDKLNVILNGLNVIDGLHSTDFCFKLLFLNFIFLHLLFEPLINDFVLKCKLSFLLQILSISLANLSFSFFFPSLNLFQPRLDVSQFICFLLRVLSLLLSLLFMVDSLLFHLL